MGGWFFSCFASRVGISQESSRKHRGETLFQLGRFAVELILSVFVRVAARVVFSACVMWFSTRGTRVSFSPA
jgi:hypothetical protein